MLIERVNESGADGLGPLVTESEQQGLRFVRKLADEWRTGANRFDRPGEALFAARMDGRVVGVCGLNVDPYAAAPIIGRVRHLYVLLAYRRRGIGGQLIAEVVQAGHGRFDTLRLRTGNPAAAQLYERLGFHRCVDAADCTHVMRLS
jgi:GNAT superfamily N-acetyltransferase